MFIFVAYLVDYAPRYWGLLIILMSLGPVLIVVQVVAVVRVHRRWIRKSISREVLAQFLGRELPSNLSVIRCPRCDYNLVAKTGESTTCPECGLSVAEPQW